MVEEEIPVMDEEVPMTVGITLDFCRSPCKGTSDVAVGSVPRDVELGPTFVPELLGAAVGILSEGLTGGFEGAGLVLAW